MWSGLPPWGLRTLLTLAVLIVAGIVSFGVLVRKFFRKLRKDNSAV